MVSDIIKRAEKEAGCMFDDNGSDNDAMAILFGAMAREMRVANHHPKDDMTAGIILRHQLSPAGKRERKANEMLARALAAGIPPEFFRQK